MRKGRSEYACGEEVFARDVSTGFWYRARIVALHSGCLDIEWSEPFDGEELGVSESNVRRDTHGLEGTDDGPTTEWVEREQTRSRSSSEVRPIL